MEMVGVDSFLPDLRRIITGPLDISMEEAVFDACVQFCRQSELVTLSRKVTGWAQGQSLEVSDNYDLQACQLLHVTDHRDGGGCYQAGVDYHAYSPNSVTALTNMAAATLWYAAEPRKDSGLVPELLDTHYRDVVAAGAAATLYLQPDRPWTDPRRSAEYQARFVEGIRQAGRFRKNHAAPEQVEYANPVRRRSFF